MQRYLCSVSIVSLLWLLPMVAQAEADKCEQAADKSMEIRLRAYKSFAVGLGTRADKTLTRIKDGMRKERAAAIPTCRKAVEKDPTLGKGLDCIIDAKHALDMNLCQTAAIILTADSCALSVDNRNRIRFEDERKIQNEPVTLERFERIRLIMLRSRWPTIEDCNDNKDTSPQGQRILECVIAAEDMKGLRECNGSMSFFNYDDGEN